jgi:hypothetical protein
VPTDQKLKQKGWKTCISCALDETKTNKHNAAGCDPCREEFKEHVMSDTDPTTCSSCDPCQEVSVIDVTS